MMRRAFSFALAVLFAGCGTDTPMPLGPLDFAGVDFTRGGGGGDGGGAFDLTLSLGEGPPDTLGPTIVFLTPKDAQLVDGPFAIEIQIDDPSGVDEQSIVVTVSDLDK